MVSDPQDERLRDYRDLRTGSRRDRRTGSRRDRRTGSRESARSHVVIEGRLALERALSGPLVMRSVLVTPSRAKSLRPVLEHLPAGTDLLVADRDTLAVLTGFDVHRGVLASANRPSPADAAELLARHTRVVILEGLTDLENVGAVFRVAAAMNVGAVLMDDRCADPLYRRCVRVSLGWSTVIPHARLGQLPEGLDLLATAGHRSVALTPGPDAVPVDTAARNGLLDDPMALVVGAEGPGLTPATIDAATHRVAIPMSCGVDSLNAATALAVVAAFAASTRGWS